MLLARATYCGSCAVAMDVSKQIRNYPLCSMVIYGLDHTCPRYGLLLLHLWLHSSYSGGCFPLNYIHIYTHTYSLSLAPFKAYIYIYVYFIYIYIAICLQSERRLYKMGSQQWLYTKHWHMDGYRQNACSDMFWLPQKVNWKGTDTEGPSNFVGGAGWDAVRKGLSCSTLQLQFP